MPESEAALGQLIRAIQDGCVDLATANWDAALITDEDQLIAAGSEGMTALGLACKVDKVEIVSLLLSHPLIDPNLAKRTSSCLMIAAGFGMTAIVKALLAHTRIDVNQKRRDGVTALMLSVQQGHFQTTRLLLKHPRLRPSIKALFPERITPLILAIQQQQHREVSLLLQCDRMLMSENVWMRETPLEFARSILGRQPCAEPEDTVAASSAGKRIVKLLEAFEQGGCDQVEKMVELSDRLADEKPANEDDFSRELGLCSELLRCGLAPEAKEKVQELMTALKCRRVGGA